MKNFILAALAAFGMAQDDIEWKKRYAGIQADTGQRRRKKKGAGRGGFRPPRHARARAHKRAFGGICGPRIDATQFFHE